jgi:hypothetical protein
MEVSAASNLKQSHAKGFGGCFCCKRMSCRLQLLGLLLLALFVACHAAPKSADYYKLLGVDKSASERDIKKAFHRQSLK